MRGRRIGLVDFEITRYAIVGNGIRRRRAVDGHVVIAATTETVD